MKNIILFGGGISGLTVAHELINSGYTVTLIEKDSYLGGMAKTRREKNNIPSEHSWRGYGPFYKNTFDILKQIPINNNLTVYDNLTYPIDFYILDDKITTYKPKINFFDKIYLIYFLLIYFSSRSRRNEYYKIKLILFVKDKLSYSAYQLLIEFICGPGYGMEKKDASFAHYFKFISIYVLNQDSYTHYLKSTAYNANSKWHVMNQPTNEAWIDPWSKYLINKGLKIITNSELVNFNFTDNKITSAIIANNNQNQELFADDFILCINPFNAEQVFLKSDMHDLHQQHYLLNKDTVSNQISFRLGFAKNINFPVNNIGFVFADSEFNITMYPQDKSWSSDIKLDDSGVIKSLWSGTTIEIYRLSKLYNKPGLELTKEELMNDIIYQVLKSKSFQKLIFDNNNFYITKEDIIYNEIWYEWNHNGKILVQDYKKWINNVYNNEFRPDQNTKFSNLYIGGSHTKTSIDIWSMEGAVESGKIVADLISKKYNTRAINLFTHKDPEYFNILKSIDDVLYKLNLPNIIDLLIYLIIFYVIYILVNKTMN